MRNFFKKLRGDKKKAFVFTTQSMAIKTGNGDLVKKRGSGSGFYLSDYVTIESVVNGWQTTNTMGNGTAIAVPNTMLNNTTPSQPKSPVEDRKTVEPKDVFNEIKRESPEISFENLDEKIKSVSDRIKVLKEHLSDDHLVDENQTLFYLKNRAKYLKTRNKNPLDWAITSQDAVEDLCKQYKLKVVPLKQYYTLVPEEGIKEIERYTRAYKAITRDTPIFELVIKDTPAVEQKKKDRDPILLANSPLGNHLFILGVWDDEVEIVDEIIYGLK